MGFPPLLCCFAVWGLSNNATAEMAKGSRKVTEWHPHLHHPQNLLSNSFPNEDNKVHHHNALSNHCHRVLWPQDPGYSLLTHGIWWCELTSEWVQNHLLSYFFIVHVNKPICHKYKMMYHNTVNNLLTPRNKHIGGKWRGVSFLHALPQILII